MADFGVAEKDLGSQGLIDHDILEPLEQTMP